MTEHVLWILLNALGNAVLAVLAGVGASYGAAAIFYLAARQDKTDDE